MHYTDWRNPLEGLREYQAPIGLCFAWAITVALTGFVIPFWINYADASITVLSPAIEVAIVLHLSFTLFKEVRDYTDGRVSRQLQEAFEAAAPMTTGLEGTLPSEGERQRLRDTYESRVEIYRAEDDHTRPLAIRIAIYSAIVLFVILILNGFNSVRIDGPWYAAVLVFMMTNSTVAHFLMLAYWQRRKRILSPIIRDLERIKRRTGEEEHARALNVLREFSSRRDDQSPQDDPPQDDE